MGWREKDTTHELAIVEVWVWVGAGPLLSQIIYTFETFHCKEVFFNIPFKITRTIALNYTFQEECLHEEPAAPAGKPRDPDRRTEPSWLGNFLLIKPSTFTLIHLQIRCNPSDNFIRETYWNLILNFTRKRKYSRMAMKF